MQYLEHLNENQRQAVIHPDGPAMVLAGAGSGKTRVLTTRVAWLIDQGKVDPREIMLVTFTNKAAQEMNHRVAQLTGQALPFAGTFHRLAAKILRHDGHRLGLSPNYTIYDTDDQVSLLKQVYKDHGFDPKEFNPKAIKATISEAKNELLSWQEYESLASNRYQRIAADIYHYYQNELRRQQAVDFDDLLILAVQLLKQNKDVLAKYQDQLSHVLVDEYQDTNKAQYQLTLLFSRPQNNVYVVGDFAQSIYAWRGADYHNMMQLKQDFPKVAEYRLEQNYRSTQTILDAATQVISQTTSHPVLNLWTENPAADKIRVFEAATGEEEAQLITQEIDRLRSLYDYRDIVILYRTNAQSRPFEEAFVRHGVPYRLVGGFKFYERKEVKDLLGYLRLTLNPDDTVSRERVTKLGKRRLAQFEAWLAEQPAVENQAPQPLLLAIIKATQFLNQFDERDPEEASRIENVQELINVAGQFKEVATFLENVALVQDEVMADAQSDEPAQAITLMSLHSAKGLEFPVVFMVGMEEGLLPHSRSLIDPEQMEEERRLCYVGITRAKERLYFSYARRRWVYGTSQYSVRSRFLSDIAPSLLDQPVSSNFNPLLGSATQPTKPKAGGRRIVLDDAELEGVLHGEIDINTFLNS